VGGGGELELVEDRWEEERIRGFKLVLHVPGAEGLS
jgi:hypothetical protein